MDPRQHPFHLKFRQRRLFAAAVEASSIIAAPPSRVWEALTDFDSYSDWNPFTTQVKTDFEIGSPVELHVDMPTRSETVRTEWVNLIEPEQTICWGMQMGHPVFLNANRWQILTPIKGNQTEYRTVDYFSGLLAPMVIALYGEPMRLGFQAVADSLKARVESQI